MTTGFAQRARHIIERASEQSEQSQLHPTTNIACQPVVPGDKRGKSERSPHVPLDAVIVASEAERRTLDEIESRLVRLAARAAEPAATLLDHQLVADWTAIRDAKLGRRHAA